MEVLRKYLKGNSSLEGKDQAFIDAGKVWGINEVLLISHASLEKGKKLSVLADGVPVDKDGHITYVEKQKNKVNMEISGKTQYIYNIFGIKVNELTSRVKKAFDERWDTPEKAIIGGAKYIKEMYLLNGRNTLYALEPRRNE